MQIFQMYIYNMTFGEALDSSIVNKYKTFGGRACRAEWYYFHIFYFLISFLVTIVVSTIATISIFGDPYLSAQLRDLPADESTQLLLELYFEDGIMIYPLVVAYLLFFLPAISVTVRRLQDLNITYFWALPYFITYIISIYTLIVFDGSEDYQINYQDINAINTIVFLVYVLLFAKKGSYKNNRFGKNPLEKES